MDAPHNRFCLRGIEILLHMLGGASERRLCESEERFRRDEINRALGDMSDEEINEALHVLYRLAEADARRHARILARAIRPVSRRSWLAGLFWRWPWPRSRRCRQRAPRSL